MNKKERRKIAKTIRQARQVLIDDGWTRHMMGGKGRPHCVMGAFKQAEGLTNRTEKAVWEHSPAARAFGECINRPDYNAILFWNDVRMNSASQVLGALERCANKIEEG